MEARRRGARGLSKSTYCTFQVPRVYTRHRRRASRGNLNGKPGSLLPTIADGYTKPLRLKGGGRVPIQQAAPRRLRPHATPALRHGRRSQPVARRLSGLDLASDRAYCIGLLSPGGRSRLGSTKSRGGDDAAPVAVSRRRDVPRRYAPARKGAGAGQGGGVWSLTMQCVRGLPGTWSTRARSSATGGKLHALCFHGSLQDSSPWFSVRCPGPFRRWIYSKYESGKIWCNERYLSPTPPPLDKVHLEVAKRG